MNPDDTQDATQDFAAPFVGVAGRLGASPDGDSSHEGRRGPSQRSSRSAGSSTRRSRKQRNSLGEINAGREAAPCVLKSPGRPSTASRPSEGGSHRRSVHFGTVKVVPIPPRPSVALRMAHQSLSATPDSFELEVATPTNGPTNDENFALLPHGHTGTTMLVGAPPSTVVAAVPDRQPLGMHRPPAGASRQSGQGTSPLTSQTHASAVAPATGPLVRGAGWGAPGVLVDEDDDDDDGRIATPTSNPPSPPTNTNDADGNSTVVGPSSSGPASGASIGLSDNDSQGIDELLLQAEAQRVRRMKEDVEAIKARRATDASAAALAELDDMTPFEDTLVALPARSGLLFGENASEGSAATGAPVPTPLSSALPTQAQRSQPPAQPSSSQLAQRQPLPPPPHQQAQHAQLPGAAGFSGSIPPIETTSAEAIRRVSPVHEAHPAPPVPPHPANTEPLQKPSSYAGLGVTSSARTSADDLPLSPFSALHARGGAQQRFAAVPTSSMGNGAGIASPLFDSAPTGVSSAAVESQQPSSGEASAIPFVDSMVERPSPASSKSSTRLSAMAAPVQLTRQLPPASTASEDSGDIDLLAPGGTEQWLRYRAMHDAQRSPATASEQNKVPESTSSSSLTTTSDDGDDAAAAREVPLVAAVVGGGTAKSPLVHPVASAPRFDARMKMSSATEEEDEEEDGENTPVAAPAGKTAASPTTTTTTTTTTTPTSSSGDTDSGDDDDDENDAPLVAVLLQGGPASAASPPAAGRRRSEVPSMDLLGDSGTTTATTTATGGVDGPGVSSESQPFPLAQAPVVDTTAPTSSLATLTAVPSPGNATVVVPTPQGSKLSVTQSPSEGAGQSYGIDNAALSSLWNAALGGDDATQPGSTQLRRGATGGDLPTPSLVGDTASATLTRTVSLSDAPDAVRFTVGVSADELTPSLPSVSRPLSATPQPHHHRCALCDGASEEERGLLPLTVARERAAPASKIELADALATAVVDIGCGDDGAAPASGGAAMVVVGRPSRRNGGGGPSDPHSGPLLEWAPVFVHFDCALWSPEVYSEQADGALPGDPPRVLMHHVAAAIDRGSRIKCAACRQVGATLGCVVATCQRSYHYPCAVAAASGAAKLVMDVDGLTVKCSHHDRQRSQSASATGRPEASTIIGVQPKKDGDSATDATVAAKPKRVRKPTGKRAKSASDKAVMDSGSTTKQPTRRQPRRPADA